MTTGHEQENIKKRLEERKVWLKHLTQNVKSGKIVELGCGSGFVLEISAPEFRDSIIIGVDKSIKKLEEVVKKDLKNVIPIKADFTQNIFASHTFDTTIFVGSLHEVFSYLGTEKMGDALRIAHTILWANGILIIQDFLKPAPRSVDIIFRNEETKKKFFRFVNEFKPRKINFDMRGNGVKIDRRCRRIYQQVSFPW